MNYGRLSPQKIWISTGNARETVYKFLGPRQNLLAIAQPRGKTYTIFHLKSYAGKNEKLIIIFCSLVQTLASSAGTPAEDAA
jgi:hypothetical protein